MILLKILSMISEEQSDEIKKIYAQNIISLDFIKILCMIYLAYAR